MVEVPVDPKTQVAAFKELRDTALGKPETMKFERTEIEGKATFEIVLGPAAEERWKAGAIEAPAEAAIDPARPLVLPPLSQEELLALPPAFEDREIRKLALDRHLAGDDEYGVRAAVHEQFGSRDARRARRRAAQDAGSPGDVSLERES